MERESKVQTEEETVSPADSLKPASARQCPHGVLPWYYPHLGVSNQEALFFRVVFDYSIVLSGNMPAP